jgi:hypothetical protein
MPKLEPSTPGNTDDSLAGGYPITPDGRYFVVRGRLWRMSNPSLDQFERQTLVGDLMRARSAIRAANRAGDPDAVARARAAVDLAKRLLGERGPVWWTDGAPDFNRRMVRATPYAAWYDALPAGGLHAEQSPQIAGPVDKPVICSGNDQQGGTGA